MRLVLDTNTVISGLIWSGSPSQLIDAALLRQIQLISNAALLSELHDVILRSKFIKPLQHRKLDANDLFEGYAALVTIVPNITIVPTILADPSDDQVLAAALSGKADFIVSGDDRHVTPLGSFEGIRIVNAKDAVDLINRLLTK